MSFMIARRPVAAVAAGHRPPLRRHKRTPKRKRRITMPLYLIKFGYTPEEWAKTIKEPEDRRETIGPLLEAVGGKLHGLWYAFGDHDGYALAEAPDNTATAGIVLTLTGSGKFRSLSTTVLLTVEETLDALHRAQAGVLRRAQ